jgi:hypothetical protein
MSSRDHGSRVVGHALLVLVASAELQTSKPHRLRQALSIVFRCTPLGRLTPTPTPPPPPALKLAALSLSSRLTSRPQLWTKLLPRSVPALHASASVSKRFLSFPRTAQELHTTPRVRPRPAAASPPAFGLHKRFCQTDVTTDFANMASDRDILPAWSVAIICCPTSDTRQADPLPQGQAIPLCRLPPRH